MATITTILKQWQVAPSSGAPTELLLPLVYSDIVFLSQSPIELVLFYSLPCSQSHFLDTVVPKLKNSLSLTLKHFTPLAGKIIFPLTSPTMPISHYVDGDSVSLTIALSDADFNHQSGNLSRDSDQLHDFVAPFPPPTYLSDFIKFSVAAVQVTLFPNQGICIGITQHHAIGDGSTIVHFINMWASIAKLNGDLHLLASSGQKYLPFYDRSGFQGASSLTSTYWDLMKMVRPVVSSRSSLSTTTDSVRATFVLSEDHIEKLNNFILSKKPSSHVSSFAAVCAHVWTSLARSAGKEVADDEPEYFNCAVDCRGRLNPPLPITYFGNCLAYVLTESTHGRLKGDQGIVVAAEVITEAIQKAINNEKGILDGSLKRLLQQGMKRMKLNGKQVLSISGSPRFDFYGADFGLGKPRKFEIVHLDPGFVCLSRSREFGGGVEIGLSMSKVKMGAFAASFSRALKEVTQNTQFSRL